MKKFFYLIGLTILLFSCGGGSQSAGFEEVLASQDDITALAKVHPKRIIEKAEIKGLLAFVPGVFDLVDKKPEELGFDISELVIAMKGDNVFITSVHIDNMELYEENKGSLMIEGEMTTEGGLKYYELQSGLIYILKGKDLFLIGNLTMYGDEMKEYAFELLNKKSKSKLSGEFTELLSAKDDINYCMDYHKFSEKMKKDLAQFGNDETIEAIGDVPEGTFLTAGISGNEGAFSIKYSGNMAEKMKLNIDNVPSEYVVGLFNKNVLGAIALNLPMEKIAEKVNKSLGAGDEMQKEIMESLNGNASAAFYGINDDVYLIPDFKVMLGLKDITKLKNSIEKIASKIGGNTWIDSNNNVRYSVEGDKLIITDAFEESNTNEDLNDKSETIKDYISNKPMAAYINLDYNDFPEKMKEEMPRGIQMYLKELDHLEFVNNKDNGSLNIYFKNKDRNAYLIIKDIAMSAGIGGFL